MNSFEEFVQSIRNLVRSLEEHAAMEEISHAEMDLLNDLKALLRDYDSHL